MEAKTQILSAEECQQHDLERAYDEGVNAAIDNLRKAGVIVNTAQMRIVLAATAKARFVFPNMSF